MAKEIDVTLRFWGSLKRKKLRLKYAYFNRKGNLMLCHYSYTTEYGHHVVNQNGVGVVVKTGELYLLKKIKGNGK